MTDRKLGEWWLVPARETELTALAFLDRNIATDVSGALGLPVIHVREVLEDDDVTNQRKESDD